MNPKFTLTKRHNVPVIEFTERVKVGDTVTILAQADEHWDNVHTNQELIAIHMQEAVDLGWPIIKLGDQLCLMQGKTDGRASKADLAVGVPSRVGSLAWGSIALYARGRRTRFRSAAISSPMGRSLRISSTI